MTMGLMQHERYGVEGVASDVLSFSGGYHEYVPSSMPFHQYGPIYSEYLPQQRIDVHGQFQPQNSFHNQNNGLPSGKRSVMRDARFLRLDTSQDPHGAFCDYPHWTNTNTGFDYNGLVNFNKRSNNHAPLCSGSFDIDERQSSVHISSNLNPELSSTPYCSDSSNASSERQSRTPSAIDPRELFHRSPGSAPALSGYSSAVTSFDGTLEQSYGNPESDGSPQWLANMVDASEPAYSISANMRGDGARFWNAENAWATVGDSGSQAKYPHHGLPSYTDQSTITNSTTTAMSQRFLYSVPTGISPQQNISFAQANVDQHPISYNTGMIIDPPIYFFGTQDGSTVSTPATPFLPDWQRPTHGYGRIHGSTAVPQLLTSSQPALTTKPDERPSPRAAPTIPPPPPAVQTRRTFTALNSKTPAPRKPSRTAATAPAPPVRKTQILKNQDLFLVQAKIAGMSYKEIREEGRFVEAESTLRGRFRSLTKAKSARVRKPLWTKSDIRLLEDAVVKLTPPGANAATGRRKRSAVPWKKVAEEIYRRGGSYLFGNATCRKKWDELNNKR